MMRQRAGRRSKWARRPLRRDGRGWAGEWRDGEIVMRLDND